MQKATVTTHQRIGSSLLSVLLAAFITNLCFSIASRDWIGSVLTLSLFSSPFCVVGWFLALPIILNFRRIDSWRFWALAIVGSSIGPFVLFSIGLCFEVSALIRRTSSPNWDPMVKNWIYMATCISCLATLIYLSLVRLENRKEPVLIAGA